MLCVLHLAGPTTPTPSVSHNSLQRNKHIAQRTLLGAKGIATNGARTLLLKSAETPQIHQFMGTHTTVPSDQKGTIQGIHGNPSELLEDIWFVVKNSAPPPVRYTKRASHCVAQVVQLVLESARSCPSAVIPQKRSILFLFTDSKIHRFHLHHPSRMGTIRTSWVLNQV